MTSAERERRIKRKRARMQRLAAQWDAARSDLCCEVEAGAADTVARVSYARSAALCGLQRQSLNDILRHYRERQNGGATHPASVAVAFRQQAKESA